MSRQPAASAQERAELASQFSFRKLALNARDVPGGRSIREVEPQLRRIDGWISSVGAAVALGDLDGDGLPNDACLVDPRTDTVTVLPAPGTPPRYTPFELRPPSRPDLDRTTAPMGCLPGDFNEDGAMDLLVTYWGRTPVLFLRQPGGPIGAAAFVSQELVDRQERWYTNAVTQADVDGDGHLDLVVGNYFPDGSRVLDTSATSDPAMQMQDSMSRAHNSGRNRVLLWKAATPRVRFEEAPGVFPGNLAYGWTLAVGAADLDGDLKPELYFANDFGPDRLFHNESTPGHVKLRLVTGRRDFTTPASKVLGQDSFKGMGVAFGDLNGDGRLDIFASNITSPFALQESNFAFMNTGDLGEMSQGRAPFVDRSEEMGLSRSGWSWDAKIADLNNDGTPEIIQATGFVKGSVNRWPELHELAIGNDGLIRDPRMWPRFNQGDDLSGHQANALFVRDRPGHYANIATDVGMGDPFVSRGIAVADVDGDGGLDFAIANQWEPSFLYLNRSPDRGAFLGLNLELPVKAGPNGEQLGSSTSGVPGRPAIGATATVHLPGGGVLVEQVDGGNGHGGFRSPQLVFGLGRHAPSAPLRVDVAWRDQDGHAQRQTFSLSPGWHTVLLGSQESVISGR